MSVDQDDYYDEIKGRVTTAVSDISIIGCSLSIVNQSAVVDSKTKILVSAQPNAAKMQSEWQTWNPAPEYVYGPQLDMVSHKLSTFILGCFIQTFSGH
jgi:hypothetical protein